MSEHQQKKNNNQAMLAKRTMEQLENKKSQYVQEMKHQISRQQEL